MGEWKAPLSLRVRNELRAQLEQYAAREKRTLGNLGELLVEWGFEQLKIAGSTERLGKARSFISKCELGERRVDFVELQKLAKIYGKDLRFFVD